MKDGDKIISQLTDELTQLRLQNAAMGNSINGIISHELAAEEARRYAESIVETIREPLLVLDAGLKIISANRNFYKTFKVTPDETIGSYIYDLGDKQWDIPKLRELLEEVLPEKEAFDDFEVEHNFENIGHKIMLLNARQIHRKDSGAKMILLAIEDVTARRRTEILLKDSEDLYRGIFKTASDGILLLEKSEGKITHANPAAEKMLGYSTKEVVGNKLQDIGFMIDTSDFHATMQILDKNGIINYNEIPVTTKTGQHMHADIYLVNKTMVVQCNIRDITERKRAEQELRASEKKYRTVVENANEAIFVVQDMKLVFANRATGHMIGYSKEILKSKTITEFIHPHDRNMVADYHRKRLKGEKVPRVYSFRVISQDGTVKWTELNTAVIKWKEKPATLNFLNDITERKQALEKMKKALNATVQLISKTVEMKDPYTSGHQQRVADLALAMATEMGLSTDQQDFIYTAATIHDIGKIAIPADILSKPSKLTPPEFDLMKTHNQASYNILKDIEFPWPVADVVLQHHERMDGSGYPHGLKGDEILPESRILAVADVVAAMSSHRPYRPTRGLDFALEEISKNKGVLYDENSVNACLELFGQKGFHFYLA